MIATVTLLSLTWMTGQAPDGFRGKEQWLLAPRLRPLQEPIYRGSFTERTLGSEIRFEREYRFTNRLFVLGTTKKSMDVAFLTIFRDKLPLRPGEPAGKNEETRSVRLSLAKVDNLGQVSALQEPLPRVPLKGPPLLETGAFAPFPLARVSEGRSWTERPQGEPVRLWRHVSVEEVNGARCLKLEGVQQSADWDRPRADSTAWRRRDLVWISPQWGIAQRVERTIETRLPARTEPTHRSVLRYELESNLQYTSRLVEDQVREIRQSEELRQLAAPMLKNPVPNKQGLTAINNKIELHMSRHPETPYRAAMIKLKRQVEAGLRGEIPPALPSEILSPVGTPKTQGIAVGKAAPDFLAPRLDEEGFAKIKEWQGKPVLMVFYRPTSRTLDRVLLFVEQLRLAHPDLKVVALAMSGKREDILNQAREKRIDYPVLNGSGLRKSYNVESTPKLVVVDEKGIVRGEHLGWGSGTPHEVVLGLHQWLK